MKTSIIISFVLFALTIIHTNAKSQQNDQNLIETTCKHTPNYPLCIKTIRAEPTSAGADVAGLGFILVEAVKAKSKVALSAARRLSRTQPKLAKPLKECADVYKAVIEADVPEAEQSVRGNPKFAENGMADAAVEADVCEAAFKGVAKSPLTAANNAVRDLAVVARAIIRNLL
ncbi:cell wall / vacuolar inhibitor of fructosidase 1 [Phtheirospermum japonicum]|uniref:Cell wall / vacuolar inhibitor of fructosidase 1 n=1 Tax=Phtheirospermum japonicum TaxID=374723 RepID=A0A830CQC7_9LAMI|nr:cell wall / vacuolar inhibitor of fructosidase 1 [Phtheirospermum japonicum]